MNAASCSAARSGVGGKAMWYCFSIDETTTSVDEVHRLWRRRHRGAWHRALRLNDVAENAVRSHAAIDASAWWRKAGGGQAVYSREWSVGLVRLGDEFSSPAWPAVPSSTTSSLSRTPCSEAVSPFAARVYARLREEEPPVMLLFSPQPQNRRFNHDQDGYARTIADRGFAGWAFFALYVQQKLLMFVLAYNLVRMQMVDAAVRQKVDPLRISFIDALRAIQSQAGVPPDEARSRSESVPLIINPHRPGRHEPRTIKRCPPQRRLLTESREKARKRLYRQGVAR